MPIGSAKIGVLGAGLVPGGTTTFNASGTFTVPPGVKKVNITGKGGTGNPGNPGNPGNAGNQGTGGGGGGGGGQINNNFPGFCVYRGGCGGYAFKSSPFIVNSPGSPSTTTAGARGNANPLCCGNNGNAGGSGGSGDTGNAGTAGTAGTAGNAGNSSTGLCKTFNGGAGGNAGAAGSAGTGGAGGPGGNGGGGAAYNTPKPAYPIAPAGSAGTGGGPGGVGRPAAAPRPPPGTGTYFTGGIGGGGAGTTNSGGTGAAGGTYSPFPVSFCGNYPFWPPLISQGGTYPSVTAPLPNNSTWNPTLNPSMVGGPSGSFLGTRDGLNAVTLTVGNNPPANVTRLSFCNFTGNCKPGILRAGAGGGHGSMVSSNLPAPNAGFMCYIRTAGGGGGGARGGAGNTGAGGSGGTGSAATPSTFNCVPVTPGSSYPIVVGGPSGGQVVISWNPQ